jgi:hypothetical protein
LRPSGAWEHYLRFGYREVLCGMIRDDVVRVSLVKGGKFNDGADMTPASERNFIR